MRARWSATRAAAWRTAPPAMTAVRLPQVPMPPGSAAVSPSVTVTLVDIGSEDVGGHLGQGRLVALALRFGAHHDGDLAVGQDRDGGHLPGAEAARHADLGGARCP